MAHVPFQEQCVMDIYLFIPHVFSDLCLFVTVGSCNPAGLVHEDHSLPEVCFMNTEVSVDTCLVIPY